MRKIISLFKAFSVFFSAIHNQYQGSVIDAMKQPVPNAMQHYQFFRFYTL